MISLSYLFRETEAQRGERAGEGHSANGVCDLTPPMPRCHAFHPDNSRPDRLCCGVQTTADKHHPCEGIKLCFPPRRAGVGKVGRVRVRSS